MNSVFCPLCDVDFPLPYDAKEATCPDCEAQFTVDYDMDGPELHWDEEVSQTPKALAAYSEWLAEEAAYVKRMQGLWSAIKRARDTASTQHPAVDVGGYYARCAAEYAALRDLKASKPWTYEEERVLNREIDIAANTGD